MGRHRGGKQVIASTQIGKNFAGVLATNTNRGCMSFYMFTRRRMGTSLVRATWPSPLRRSRQAALVCSEREDVGQHERRPRWASTAVVTDMSKKLAARSTQSQCPFIQRDFLSGPVLRLPMTSPVQALRVCSHLILVSNDSTRPFAQLTGVCGGRRLL